MKALTVHTGTLL